MEQPDERLATPLEGEQEFARLLADHEFRASKRARSLLTFLIEAKLRGVTRIDCRDIAQEVLGRGRDFDPTSDPIVRIEMARLRMALKFYYEKNLGTRVCIAIRPRSYIPVFEYREIQENFSRVVRPISPSSPPLEPSNVEGSPEVPRSAELLQAAEFYTLVVCSGLVMAAGTALAIAALI